MNNALNNFVMDFLEYPKTFVEVNTKSNIDGFALKNKELDIQLNIFSDKNNSIYFELFYDEPFAYKPDRSYPTFKADNLDEYKPLLIKLLEHLDSTNKKNFTPEYNSFSNELFSLHRKALKNEKLPDGYEFPNGYKHDILNSHVVIMKNDNFFSSLSRDTIFKSLSTLQKHNDPLTFLKIYFEIFGNNTMHDNFIYVPNYDIESYPLLDQLNKLEPKNLTTTKANTKHYEKVTDSLSDWFKKILEKPEIQNSPLNNIILKNYLLIDLNSENNSNKKRVKI